MKFNLLTIFSVSIFCLHHFCNIAQQDFNNFKTLKSIGSIPKDFSSLTFEKINEDLNKDNKNLSEYHKKVFLEGIHYSIDDLLHSGMVVYGDEISVYVNKVASNLLKNEPDLFSKLRFYTLKSNESNALSTDQGIVFVTTGLISQLTSEAQLALVLAHEISHYTEKHVIESFEYKVNKENRGQNISKLSTYTKEKELEADRLGLKWYHDAGYSKEEIIPTFDVMMYSYLPFDEVEFPTTYFNTSGVFVPESFFPSSKFDIQAVEDYDDSQSTHPNIKTRKEQISSEISNYTNWGTQVNTLGKNEFEYVRKICRFESIRTDILNANFGNALYSIFLLEKENKNSIYLDRMKAQAWLGLLQHTINNNTDGIINKNSKLEGEFATLHYFLSKLNQEALSSISLRQIYDLKKTYPEDKQIAGIYFYLLKTLAKSEFKVEKFSTIPFEQATIDYEKLKNTKSDTSKVITEGSKYDKIRSKNKIENPDKFDSTKFYLYSIPDIIIDEEFISTLNSEKEIHEKEKVEEGRVEKLTKKEAKKEYKKQIKNELKIGVDELIIVEPIVYSYKNREINLIESEKLQQDLSEVLEISAHDADLKIHTIDRNNLVTKGTEIFNERSVLFSIMIQLARSDDENTFPVDFESLEEIKSSYNTSNVMFTWVEHRYTPKINAGIVYLGIVFYPIIPIYVPISLLKGHYTELSVVILNIETGKIDTGTNYTFNDIPKKFHLGAHMFDLFKKIKTTKTN